MSSLEDTLKQLTLCKCNSFIRGVIAKLARNLHKVFIFLDKCKEMVACLIKSAKKIVSLWYYFSLRSRRLKRIVNIVLRIYE